VTYKPTGKPPGRPRKDGTPPKPKAEPKAEPKEAERQLVVVPGQERPYNVAPACPACHPDGWPEGWTGYGCQHGIWARRV
jgi:hypothetical protein